MQVSDVRLVLISVAVAQQINMSGGEAKPSSVWEVDCRVSARSGDPLPLATSCLPTLAGMHDSLSRHLSRHHL